VRRLVVDARISLLARVACEGDDAGRAATARIVARNAGPSG